MNRLKDKHVRYMKSDNLLQDARQQLCVDTDEDIARYSILHENEQLFASKYKTYLPLEEKLRAEIDAQKGLFYLQQKEQLNE